MKPLDPIRNINQSKRKYTSRACEGCRRRRAKCDGARPSCTRCVSRGQICSYSAEEDGRRPAPKSYVELLRGRIDALEKVLRMHSIDVDAAVAAIKAQDKSFLEPSLGGEPLSSGERIDTGITPSNLDELYATFEGALSLDESLNYEQDGEIRYFGSTSGRLDFRWDSNHSLQGAPSLRACNQRAEMNSCIPSSQEHDVSEELKSHLIELYFTWQQPWCQVVDETFFRQRTKTQGRYYSPFLENCILAFGSRFSDRLEIRSDPNDCNTAGRRFFEKAELLLPFDLKWPSITTISVFVSYSIGADAAGWLHQGMASRLALDMGFNLDASSLIGSSLISVEEVELRRQIYWSLYCDEKISAAYTGRVCTTLDFQGSVKFLRFRLPLNTKRLAKQIVLHTNDG